MCGCPGFRAHMLSSLWTAPAAKLHRTGRPNISLPYFYGDRDWIAWRRRYCIGCIVSITTALTSFSGTNLPPLLRGTFRGQKPRQFGTSLIQRRPSAAACWGGTPRRPVLGEPIGTLRRNRCASVALCTVESRHTIARGWGRSKDIGQGACHDCSLAFRDSRIKRAFRLEKSSLASQSLLVCGDTCGGMSSRACRTIHF
jgi:hypothetical protein